MCDSSLAIHEFFFHFQIIRGQPSRIILCRQLRYIFHNFRLFNFFCYLEIMMISKLSLFCADEWVIQGPANISYEQPSGNHITNVSNFLGNNLLFFRYDLLIYDIRKNQANSLWSKFLSKCLLSFNFQNFLFEYFIKIVFVQANMSWL